MLFVDILYFLTKKKLKNMHFISNFAIMWLTDTCVKLLKTAGADKKSF